jgi:thiamine kinase-like enzyme
MADLTGILDRLELHLGARRGHPSPLDGGITNRNYRVAFGSGDYVVRVPGNATELLGIDRESERLAAVEAARLGIGPPLAYADAECSVTAFVEAVAIDPAALRADPAPIARALRAFHDSGVRLPSRFWVPELLDRYATLVFDRGGAPPEAFGRARALVRRIAEVLPLVEPVPCHDDLLAGNVLVPGSTAEGGVAGRVLLVDWEYAGMGHRYFDLANLAVNNDFDEAAEARLLSAYFGSPVSPDRQAALTLLKLVSDAREAAWGVVQGLLSELDFDFAAYAAEHYERLERAAADPRLERWLDAAAA